MLKALNVFIKRLLSFKALSIIVLVLVTINMFMIGGKRRNFGIFVSALYRSFNDSSLFELNMVGDSYTSFANILMPFLASLVCYMNNSYQVAMFSAGIFIMVSSFLTSIITEPWQLFASHTLLHGIGSGLILATVALVVGDYYNKTHKYHVLATSLGSSGAYGVIILTPLYAKLVETYGWRETFVIIGIMFLILSWLAAIFFIPITEPYEEIGETGNKKKVSKWKFCSWEHVKTHKQTMFYLIDRVLGGIIIFGVMMNLTEYSRRTISDNVIDSSWINIYLGIGEGIIFTITLLTGDKFRGKLRFIPFTGIITSFVSVFLMKVSINNPNLTSFITGLLGFSLGFNTCVTYAVSSEILKIDGSVSLPMAKMTSAIGAIISPFFSGLIIDKFSFEGLFNSLLVLLFMRFILFSSILFILYRKNDDDENDDDKKPEEEFLVVPPKLQNIAESNKKDNDPEK